MRGGPTVLGQQQTQREVVYWAWLGSARDLAVAWDVEPAERINLVYAVELALIAYQLQQTSIIKVPNLVQAHVRTRRRRKRSSRHERQRKWICVCMRTAYSKS